MNELAYYLLILLFLGFFVVSGFYIQKYTKGRRLQVIGTIGLVLLLFKFVGIYAAAIALLITLPLWFVLEPQSNREEYQVAVSLVLSAIGSFCSLLAAYYESIDEFHAQIFIGSMNAFVLCGFSWMQQINSELSNHIEE